MNEPVVIEGWTCELHYDGDGMVMVREAWAPNGRVAHHVHGKWTAIHEAMPPAVLAWLIRPLLRDAWVAGVMAAATHPTQSIDAASHAALPALLATNPHKDP